MSWFFDFGSASVADLASEAFSSKDRYCFAPGLGTATAEPGGSLPCQDSNNSDKDDWNKLASNHRKTAHALRKSIQNLAARYGIERLGFLTLTFADHVLDAREASRRFNNLSRRVLAERYNSEFVKVMERQESGRIHFHLIVVCREDIRTGVNFEEIKECKYRSAGKALRSEWAFWRKTCPKYGFGYHELLPIRSTAEAIADYAGKYIAKHIGNREERDKGVRLVSYGKGLVGTSSCRFGWNSSGSRNWRRKLAFLARFLGYTPQDYEESFLRDFGSTWSFHLSKWIMRIKFSTYPTAAEACADWEDVILPEGATSVRLPDKESESKQLQAATLMIAFNLRATYKGKQNDSKDDGSRNHERDNVGVLGGADRREFVPGVPLPDGTRASGDNRVGCSGEQLPTNAGGEFSDNAASMGFGVDDGQEAPGARRSSDSGIVPPRESEGSEGRKQGGPELVEALPKKGNSRQNQPSKQRDQPGGRIVNVEIFHPQDADEVLADWEVSFVSERGMKNTTLITGP